MTPIGAQARRACQRHCSRLGVRFKLGARAPRPTRPAKPPRRRHLPPRDPSLGASRAHPGTGGGGDGCDPREAAFRRRRGRLRGQHRGRAGLGRAGLLQRPELRVGQPGARARARAADGGPDGGLALLVGCVALASKAAAGLWLTVLAVIAARVVWAGILTVRAAIWTANYPRNVLARITGRIVIVNALAVGTSAALVGWVLEGRAVEARWLYGAGALVGLLGAWLYRAMRVRREFQLLAAEAASVA